MRTLVDSLRSCKSDYFEHKKTSPVGAHGAEWYLHLVIFPSLLKIAERMETLEALHSKSTDMVDAIASDTSEDRPEYSI